MRKVWVGVGAAVLAACGSDALSAVMGDAGELASDAGGLLRDAGEWLSDAGAGARDAGEQLRGDAQAQGGGAEVYEVACDEKFERVISGAAVTTTQTYWFATVQTDTSDVSGVDAVLCDLEVFTTLGNTCPDGATCTGASAPPSPDCVAQAGAQLPNGLVRVSCGHRHRADYADNSVLPDSDSGERRRSVRITIRR